MTNITITDLNEGDIVVATQDIKDMDRLMPKGTVGIVNQCSLHWMSVSWGDPLKHKTNHVNPGYEGNEMLFIRVRVASTQSPVVHWSLQWRGLSRRYKNRKRGMKETLDD